MNPNHPMARWEIESRQGSPAEQLLKQQLEVVAQVELAAAVKAGTLSADQYQVVADLYPVWEAGKAVVAGQVYRHLGILYSVVQSHTTQADWEPQNVPALFTRHTPSGVIGLWIPPTGAHDAYPQGAVVEHNGQQWQSTIPANVWEPGRTSYWVQQ